MSAFGKMLEELAGGHKFSKENRRTQQPSRVDTEVRRVRESLKNANEMMNQHVYDMGRTHLKEPSDIHYHTHLLDTARQHMHHAALHLKAAHAAASSDEERDELDKFKPQFERIGRELEAGKKRLSKKV